LPAVDLQASSPELAPNQQRLNSGEFTGNHCLAYTGLDFSERRQ
jgi:hypothetical protein